MAAVPVSLMHHTGLQIPQMATGAPGAAGQMMLPVSTMLSMNMNAVPLTTSTMTSMMNGGYHQPQFQPTAAELSNGCAQGLTFLRFCINQSGFLLLVFVVDTLALYTLAGFDEKSDVYLLHA